MTQNSNSTRFKPYIPSNTLVLISFISLSIILSLLDIITTQYILSSGGFEYNPLLTGNPGLIYPYKAAGLIFVGIMAIVADKVRNGTSWMPFAAFGVVTVVVVVHNALWIVGWLR